MSNRLSAVLRLARRGMNVFGMLLLWAATGLVQAAIAVSPSSGEYDPLLGFDESKWDFNNRTAGYGSVNIANGQVTLTGSAFNGPNTADNAVGLSSTISAKTWSADIRLDNAQFETGGHPSGITIRMAEEFIRNGTNQYMEVDFFLGKGSSDFIFGYVDFRNGAERFNLRYSLPPGFSIREFHNYKLVWDSSDFIRYYIDNTEIASVQIPAYDSIARHIPEYFRITGKVTASIKNIRYADAVYPEGANPPAEPLAPLTALSISAPTSLQSGSSSTLTANATYSNSSKTVTPTWTSSDPGVASISSSGVLTSGSVSIDTPVTITASYTESGKTVTASQTVTITAAPASLSSLAISGGSTVSSAGLLRLAASATYADSSSRGVSGVTWSTSAGSINNRGELTAPTVSAGTAITVSASYSESGVTKTASQTVSVKTATGTLDSLAIVGARGTLATGETLNLAAESGYADGSSKRIPATWSASNTAASINASGVVTAQTVTTDTPVIITARHTEGGKTVTANYSLMVQTSATAPQLTAEVIARVNTKNQARLQLWFNSDAQAAVRGNRSGRQLKVYVAAIVPAGALVSTPTFFVLNRSKQWNVLSWPLAEYLSGVNAGEWRLIELLDGVDLSLIAGAQILVGYGESETDMLENQRYRLAYQVPYRQ